MAASFVEEALTIAQQVQLGPLEIDWSALEWSQPILDLHMFISAETNQVEYKPYCKACNNLE